MIPVFLGGSIVLFALLYILPGDPAVVVLGESAPPATLAVVRHQLGLDLPWYERYFSWLGHMLQGDFGVSLIYHQPVAGLLHQRLPITVELGLWSILIALLIAIPAGIYSGLRPNSLLTRAVDLLNATAIAIPVFWLALLMQIVFALQLGWLPAVGYVHWDEDPVMHLESLLLPSVTLAVGTVPVLARFLAAGVREAVSQDYVLTARAKGLPPLTVVMKHIVRNAVLPTITVLGITLGRLAGGAVLTEAVFNIPGMGSLLWSALLQRDYLTIQAITVIVLAAFLFINLATDVVYAVVDPRLRASISG
jgi:peptide/nickel transport system permease protein